MGRSFGRGLLLQRTGLCLAHETLGTGTDPHQHRRHRAIRHPYAGLAVYRFCHRATPYRRLALSFRLSGSLYARETIHDHLHAQRSAPFRSRSSTQLLPYLPAVLPFPKHLRGQPDGHQSDQPQLLYLLAARSVHLDGTAL